MTKTDLKIPGSELKLKGCTLSRQGAVFDEMLSFEDWQTVGQTLHFMEGAILFWIGDWVNFGEKKYGEKYAQALENTGYEYGTLRNAAWVASNIEMSRRRDNVSFSHHQEVAALDSDQQDEWLERAETDKMNQKEFRNEIKRDKRRKIAEKHISSRLTGATIIEGDFREKCDEISDNSIGLILTDPPYPFEFLSLWDDLGKLAARVLKPSGFLVSYSGQLYLPSVISSLAAHLEWYWLAGLNHLGQCAFRHERNTQNRMKPILIFQKPPISKQSNAFHDLVESPSPSKEFHEWGQSVEPLKGLIETFSNPSDFVLDPMAGGGSTGVACQALKRNCILVELEKENIGIIKSRLT